MKNMAMTKKTNNGSKAREGRNQLRLHREKDDEIPSLDESFWSKAQMGSPLKKHLISLRLDKDVIEWFKDQGPSYQPRMNQVLRTYMEFCKREEVRK
jgi:uncharacterized protein (DUF4415 family)